MWPFKKKPVDPAMPAKGFWGTIPPRPMPAPAPSSLGGTPVHDAFNVALDNTIAEVAAQIGERRGPVWEALRATAPERLSGEGAKVVLTNHTGRTIEVRFEPASASSEDTSARPTVSAAEPDVVLRLREAVQELTARGALQDRALALVEANLADVVRDSVAIRARLEGVDKNAWPDLAKDVALSYFQTLLCVFELRRKLLDLQARSVEAR